MSDNDFEDFGGDGDPGDADAGAEQPGHGERRDEPIGERFEAEWEELDWEELEFDDLGYEPADADRVREAWRRINREYGRRGDLPGVVRMFALFNEVAGEAVSPETRRQLERVLRDLLVILRDVIDRAIERLDEDTGEVEIEEIPID